MKETGEKAEVTIKLTFEPNGSAPAGQVESILARDVITVKVPMPKTRASIFFVTDDNELTRQQQTIPGVEPMRQPSPQS